MNRIFKYLWISICLTCLSLQAAELKTEDLKASLLEFSGNVRGAANPLPSGILYDLVAPLSGIEKYDGSETAEASEFATWLQISFELRRASLRESVIPDQKHFRELRRIAQAKDKHPLALLMFDYQTARAGVDRDQIIGYENDKVTSLKQEDIITATAVSVASLHDWSYHGSDMVFSFDQENLYTNIDANAIVEFDFDDGRGFRSVPESREMFVSYPSIGTKTITVRATTRDGRTLFGRSRFHVRHLDAPPPSETWALTASHSTGGAPATGEAYILYGNGHTMVERPVILVEGLDLDNSLNWNELYDLMNQEFLIETLLSIGYDAVVLNYGNSTIAIQDNAFLVQELIEEVNSASGGVYPLVIAGTSLGGLTTRYALTYMEDNNLPHNVSTFISVDSPQNGANIPIGIQHWADFFASQSADAAAARDALLTPAPRQLLLYHLSSSSAGTANPDPLFAAFQNSLAALGDYPTQPRLVSVINGSGTMQNAGFAPGAQILSWVYDSFVIDIRGNVWAVSNTVNTRVLQGLIDLIFPFPDQSRNVFIAPCLSWDNAPGGKTATMEELAATTAPYGDIVALFPSHCFIPSVSALDLSVTDPFYNIAGAPNLYDLTPFDSVYFPVANQDHVQITPENAEWFLSEIIGPLEQPVLTIAAEADSVRLRWNTIFGANAYHVYASGETDVWPPSFTTVTGNELVTAASDSIRFFQVVAVRE
ncbi:MAG: hypothetical protein IPP40_04165 [bacterium]|nr:hypothetical protein [bacterium]